MEEAVFAVGKVVVRVVEGLLYAAGDVLLGLRPDAPAERAGERRDESR
ncbi:hypothetical protein [Streptomyces sp. NRRL S-87]|nr:hypothetical protein [Streptomyces sp. NRRL S-87]